MRAFNQYFQTYQLQHTTLINKIAHFIGVPLLIFSILIFLSWIHISVPYTFDTTLAWLLSFTALIYYVFFDMIFAGVLAIIFILLNVIALLITGNAPSWAGFTVFLVTFILGGILLLIGHLVEGKKPAFMNNHKQLLIAPLFLVAEAFFYFGYRTEIRDRLE